MTALPTFGCEYDKAPLPVLVHYGSRPLFRFKLPGADWNVELMMKDFKRGLIRADSGWSCGEIHRYDVVFGTRQGTFLHYDGSRVTIYASSYRRVVIASVKMERYLEKPGSTPATYNLLRVSRRGMETQSVELKDVAPIDPSELALNYGEGFTEWNESLIARFQEKGSGLSILEGPPGTGKTSYLRQLMIRLKETHRFYFVPPAHARIVNEPEFIGFWESEQRSHRGKRFVMILEDSEKALMERADDNRSQVSALLNITDGLLADFLKLQVICTINCAASEIDQALLRPGRPLAQRLFGRLTRDEAMRLAARLGKELPLREDYSLAEIFNEAVETPERNEKIVGFAA